MSVDSDTATSETTMEADELAAELGDAIRELPEYEAFEEAKHAVETSEEVQERIDEFESLRQEFMLARQTGEATQEDVQTLQDAQNHLHEHPVMEEYLTAQEDLQDRFEALNDTISENLAVDFVGESGACCQD
jgi:cell fate (sporulation/competence/biofilm development) regulator YlbF (YheA/YmcA/DUF963 family)